MKKKILKIMLASLIVGSMPMHAGLGEWMSNNPGKAVIAVLWAGWSCLILKDTLNLAKSSTHEKLKSTHPDSKDRINYDALTNMLIKKTLTEFTQITALAALAMLTTHGISAPLNVLSAKVLK